MLLSRLQIIRTPVLFTKLTILLNKHGVRVLQTLLVQMCTELGKVKGMIAKIHVDPNATLQFFKAWTVPCHERKDGEGARETPGTEEETSDMNHRENIGVGIRARPPLERYTYRSRVSYFMHLRATKWVG